MISFHSHPELETTAFSGVNLKVLQFMARGDMDIPPLRELDGVSSGNFFLHAHMYIVSIFIPHLSLLQTLL